MTTTPAQAELLPYVQMIFDAHMAIARSESNAISTDTRRSVKSGPTLYNASADALDAALELLTGDKARGARLRDLMLDDSGEGVAYWLDALVDIERAEALADEYIVCDEHGEHQPNTSHMPGDCGWREAGSFELDARNR